MMKSRPRCLQTLLCLLVACSLLSAVDLPTTVQFDLVFPRNNTVYKPVYPFPVVFGLHNGSAAWSYNIHWDWEIYTVDENRDMIASGGYIPGIPGEEKPAPPPDVHLIIDPVSEIINTTVQKLFLRYDFGITNSCNETTGEVPTDRDLDVSFAQGVTFSLDRENGVIPDVTASGPCAVPVGSIGIQKDVPTWDGGVCPILMPGPQPTQECALRVDETVASRVEERMHEHTKCPDESVRFVTGATRERCGGESSGGDRIWRNGMVSVLTMRVAGFGGLLLL